MHLRLRADTEDYLGREQLALMRPTAFLINTAQGGLVDKQALIDATPHNGGMTSLPAKPRAESVKTPLSMRVSPVRVYFALGSMWSTSRWTSSTESRYCMLKGLVT